jgi:hypothetical protein
VKSVPSIAFPVYVNVTVKSSVGAWVTLTVYGVVVLPSTTDVGPSILTYAVCVSGSVGVVSSGSSWGSRTEIKLNTSWYE